jgi:hypothetical protein
MKKILLILLVTIGFSGYSQLVFQEDFSSFTVNANLSGQGAWTNNSSNPGGLGSCVGAICSNAKVKALGVTYAGYGASANSVEIFPDTDGCGRNFTAVSSGDVYIAMVLNLSNCSTAASPGDFFRVMSGGNFNTAFRLFAKSIGTGFQIGFYKGGASTIVFTPNGYAFNQDHLIVVKYSTLSGTADDVLNVYVDPTFASGEPATPTATTIAGTDQAGNIDRLCFRQNSSANMPTGKAGLVSVSTTWVGLKFPAAGLEAFNKNTFQCIANQTSKGVLSVKSEINLENATLNIYSITGALVETKKLNIVNGFNDFVITPLQNATPFVVEIVSENRSFSQKIIAQ